MQRGAAASLRRVLIVTPMGQGGAGGIDRMMDALRPRAQEFAVEGFEAQFCASRGAGSLALAPFHLARTLARVAAPGVDLVHINLSSHGSVTRKLTVAATARRFGRPYVVHLHGSRFADYFDAAGPGRRAAILSLFTRAARVAVLGRVWRDWLAERAPAAAPRIDILPNAVAAPSALAPRPPGAPAHILFLGRLGPRKGSDELLQALALLPPGPAWRATLAGDGDVRGLARAIAGRGLGGRVQAPGWVGPAQVQALLADSDIVALPSHQENLPMSLIEGMAYGRAVIGTPVGAVTDIVRPGETGLLVPPGDVPALTGALRSLIEDLSLRARLGEAAMKMHRERLDLDGYAGRLSAIWRAAQMPVG
jgi:glycosyltransferase involved in cell wall biosynthesis